MVLAAGTFIAGNRYEVIDRLGGGADGDVYEATDHHEQDTVAVKLLGVTPGTEWDEARVLRRLSDEHILPIRNADVDSGQSYLVTELATHGTLANAVDATNGCGLNADAAVRFIRQACHGIARAHDVRLTHNDIKPPNLFLNAEGECMVGDFGFASLVPPGANTAPVRGGSAPVMAPEVAASLVAGVGAGSFASDVYSLGASAYWLLAGRAPYELNALPPCGPRWTVVATQPPQRLCDAAPHVPSYVAKAVERAMSRDPNHRFATVTEFAEVLGRRPEPRRDWRRTDEHGGHIACFVGEKSGASTYVMCVEQGSTAKKAKVTTTHQGSGMGVSRGCKDDVSMKGLAQAVRSAIRALG
jgi:serine/threonine-protein kinase